MPVFESSFTVRASVAAVSAFHYDTRVLRLLTPPPIFLQLHRVDPLAEGSTSIFTLWFGPLPIRWTALHSEVDPQRGFTDTQLVGPLKRWRHTHTFTNLGDGRTRVDDHLEFEHQRGPQGWLTRALYASFNLNFLFAYRERVTRRAVERVASL